MHFADWFARHAAARSPALAVVTPDVKLTYAEFHGALLATAQRLKECGIERGQTVAVSVENPALLCVLLAALNRLGVATLSCNWPDDATHSVGMLDGVRVDGYVIEQPFPGVIPNGTVNVDPDWLKPAQGEAMDLDASGFRDGNEISAIFATSETRGVVRAVGLTSRQLEARILKHSIGRLGEGRSETTFSLFSLCTLSGFRIAFETFWAGGTLFLGWPSRLVPAILSRNRIFRMYAPPSQFQAILQMSDPSEFDLSSLRYALVEDGTDMPRQLIAALRKKLCERLINLYGLPETGLIAFGRLAEEDAAGHCGVLVPWMQAEIVNGEGDAVPAGAEGTLRLRCAEMVMGYLNDPEASAECFRDGWFYPGDTGQISEQGRLTIAGASARTDARDQSAPSTTRST